MTIHSQWNLSNIPEESYDAVHPGDRVCTGANVHVHHEVIAVYGEKAWIRDLRSGCDGITSLSRCHKY